MSKIQIRAKLSAINHKEGIIHSLITHWISVNRMNRNLITVRKHSFSNNRSCTFKTKMKIFNANGNEDKEKLK